MEEEKEVIPCVKKDDDTILCKDGDETKQYVVDE